MKRPVAAQTDLDVASRIDAALLDEPAHYRAVREPDAENFFAGVGVGVEVHQAKGTPVRGGAGSQVRLGDGVVSAQDHGQRAGGEYLGDGRLYGGVGAGGVGGKDRGVAVIDYPQVIERVDRGFQVRSRRATRRPDGARRETRPRPVGD
jgi:hypothetical protein